MSQCQSIWHWGCWNLSGTSFMQGSGNEAWLGLVDIEKMVCVGGSIVSIGHSFPVFFDETSPWGLECLWVLMVNAAARRKQGAPTSEPCPGKVLFGSGFHLEGRNELEVPKVCGHGFPCHRWCGCIKEIEHWTQLSFPFTVVRNHCLTSHRDCPDSWGHLPALESLGPRPVWSYCQVPWDRWPGMNQTAN